MKLVIVVYGCQPIWPPVRMDCHGETNLSVKLDSKQSGKKPDCLSLIAEAVLRPSLILFSASEDMPLFHH